MAFVITELIKIKLYTGIIKIQTIVIIIYIYFFFVNYFSKL